MVSTSSRISCEAEERRVLPPRSRPWWRVYFARMRLFFELCSSYWVRTKEGGFGAHPVQ